MLVDGKSCIRDTTDNDKANSRTIITNDSRSTAPFLKFHNETHYQPVSIERQVLQLRSKLRHRQGKDVEENNFDDDKRVENSSSSGRMLYRSLREKESAVVDYGRQFMTKNEKEFRRSLVKLKAEMDKEISKMGEIYRGKIVEIKRAIRILERRRENLEKLQASIRSLEKRLYATQNNEWARRYAQQKAALERLRAEEDKLKVKLDAIEDKRSCITEMRKDKLNMEEELIRLAKREEILRATFLQKRKFLKRSTRGVGRMRMRVGGQLDEAEGDELEKLKRLVYDGSTNKTKKKLNLTNNNNNELLLNKIKASKQKVFDEQQIKSYYSENYQFGKLEPGEEMNIPWRLELRKVVKDVVEHLDIAIESYENIKQQICCSRCKIIPQTSYILVPGGENCCLKCARLHQSSVDYFENIALDQLKTRLGMNLAFESAIQSADIMLKDDVKVLQKETIGTIQARFEVYLNILKWNQSMATADNQNTNGQKRKTVAFGDVAQSTLGSQEQIGELENAVAMAATKLARLWRQRKLERLKLERKLQEELEEKELKLLATKNTRTTTTTKKKKNKKNKL